MADMFSDANNVALEFGGGGGEIRIVQLVVNFFPEVEAEERTDIRGGTSEALHGDPIDGSAEGVVEEEAGIHKAEEPGVWWSTGPIKDDIGGGLDHLDAPFSRVLVLLVWLAKSILNHIVAVNVQNFFILFVVFIVSVQHTRSSLFSDEISIELREVPMFAETIYVKT